MNDEIRSTQNPRVKAACQLRQGRGRQQQQRFLVDGLREIDRALEANWPMEEVFVCDELLSQSGDRELRDKLEHAGIPLCPVTSSVMEKITFGDRRDGLVAVAHHRPLATLETLSCTPGMLLAVVESIEKPGNLGAILRSADAAGVDAVILANQVTDPFNPNVIRASTGIIFSMPVYADSSEQILDWLTKNEFQVCATRIDGSASYLEIDWRGSLAIVLGEESSGLSSCWSGPAVTAVSIPMRGSADSLNVSTTAAILFYEALRQRESD
ncbi:MAG: RNA methyltransferase [Pirellulaceae bacterium]|jgi:TrmH family RNA methyltransferase|nr:RNA methyltransferase [Pirellulaceae bacterium]